MSAENKTAIEKKFDLFKDRLNAGNEKCFETLDSIYKAEPTCLNDAIIKVMASGETVAMTNGGVGDYDFDVLEAAVETLREYIKAERAELKSVAA